MLCGAGAGRLESSGSGCVGVARAALRSGMGGSASAPLGKVADKDDSVDCNDGYDDGGVEVDVVRGAEVAGSVMSLRVHPVLRRLENRHRRQQDVEAGDVQIAEAARAARAQRRRGVEAVVVRPEAHAPTHAGCASGVEQGRAQQRRRQAPQAYLA